MRSSLVLLSILLIAPLASWASQHDIRADSMLAPRGRLIVDYSYTPTVQFTNIGTSDESYPAFAFFIWHDGGVVYRDTAFASAMKSGETLNVKWARWSGPSDTGTYEVCAWSFMPFDQDYLNDTVCTEFRASFANEMQATEIVFPKPNDSLPFGVRFHPIVDLRNVGVKDILNQAAEVQIRKLPDYTLVLKLDTNISYLPADSSILTDTFPDHQGASDTKGLTPGQYVITAMRAGGGEAAGDSAFSTFTIVATSSVAVEDPFLADFRVYPNPADAGVTITYALVRDSYISLKLFDVTGREISTLANGYFDAGEHEIKFERGNLPAGVYFYRLEANGETQTRAIVIEP